MELTLWETNFKTRLDAKRAKSKADRAGGGTQIQGDFQQISLLTKLKFMYWSDTGALDLKFLKSFLQFRFRKSYGLA